MGEGDETEFVGPRPDQRPTTMLECKAAAFVKPHFVRKIQVKLGNKIRPNCRFKRRDNPVETHLLLLQSALKYNRECFCGQMLCQTLLLKAKVSESEKKVGFFLATLPA